MSVALPVFGIEIAGELRGEIRVPDDAVLIDDHVMRLRFLPRQVVFRIDDVGGAALRARQRLELVVARLGLAQVDLGEPIRRRLHFLLRDRRTFAARSRQQRLRMVGVLPGE